MSLFNATQFKVVEIKIVTKYGTIVDVSKVYEELNIFESILSPTLSGSIMIQDSVAMSADLRFDGAEAILIHIIKDESMPLFNLKKSFRIYKQKNRENIGLNSEVHVLYFASDELLYSEQRRVNQSYEDTYSNIASKILDEYIKPPESKISIIKPSVGLKKVVIPNLRPLEAMEWCAKRATDAKQSPNFVFFENVYGFNFTSLSSMLPVDYGLKVQFVLKNQVGKTPEQEIIYARSYELLGYVDAFERTRQGVYAGKYMGFDPITRTIYTKKITYDDHYNPITHGNPNPNLTRFDNRDGKFNTDEFDSRKSIYMYETSQKQSAYIKSHDPASLAKLENYEDFVFQRRAIFNNLYSKRAKITVPGNFLLATGVTINAFIPEYDYKLPSDDNLDDSLRGKYLIIGVRHVIGFDKHETILEVASSSSVAPATTSHPEQTKKILSYKRWE